MGAPISPVVLLDAVRRAKLQRAAEGSLIEFSKQAWGIIEPGAQFVDGWHLHAIADHLEAVSDGEIENLIINIPPGCMKSILVSVLWPTWEWIHRPHLRYLGASYGADLAIRDAQKCRDIVTSEWYQARWPQVQVRKGADQKTKYELTSGGWRMATSVGGRATGEHPDRKIVDDPTNAAQAASDAERSTANLWFDRTLSTRGKSRGARTVVVMQRLHEQDLTGHILSSERGYEHLCLPMEYEVTKRRATSIGWEDPRTAEGSLLWPELFPTKSVEQLKTELGSYGAAGQLQQRPSPEGGGILRVAHFQLWPADRDLPVFEYVVQSYDTAFEEKEQNDPSAATVWGVFEYKGKRGAMLLDAWADRLPYPKLRAKLVDEWHSVYGKTESRKGKKTDAVLIEKKASGQSLLQDLRSANIPAVPYLPQGGKVPRAHQVAPILELDCLYIPESSKRAGEFVTWAQPFVDQCEKFPNATHDDYVDTFTQAMIYLRDGGWFELDRAEDDPVEEIDYHKARKARANPYVQ